MRDWSRSLELMRARGCSIEPGLTAAELARAEERFAIRFPPDLAEFLTTARSLKRSVSWVYHRAEDGTLPVKRIGGWGLRFIPAELRAWVEGSGEAKRRTARGSKE